MITNNQVARGCGSAAGVSTNCRAPRLDADSAALAMGVSGTSPAAGSASYTSSAFQKLPCRLSVAIVFVKPAPQHHPLVLTGSRLEPPRCAAHRRDIYESGFQHPHEPMPLARDSNRNLDLCVITPNSPQWARLQCMPNIVRCLLLHGLCCPTQIDLGKAALVQPLLDSRAALPWRAYCAPASRTLKVATADTTILRTSPVPHWHARSAVMSL